MTRDDVYLLIYQFMITSVEKAFKTLKIVSSIFQVAVEDYQCISFDLQKP